MGLVTSVVLGTQSPVNIREDGLLVEIYCAKDTAAYTNSPFLVQHGNSENGHL
jgi:hypothetical protein